MFQLFGAVIMRAKPRTLLKYFILLAITFSFLNLQNKIQRQILKKSTPNIVKPTNYSDVIKSRRKHLASVCEKLKNSKTVNEIFYENNINQPKKQHLHLTIDPEHKLLWTRVAKVATCSWKYIFKQIRGRKRSKQRDYILTQNPEGIKSLWRKMEADGLTSFMFSRHPFSRILSSYRGKLENRTSGRPAEMYSRKIGGKIVSRYRTEEEKRVNKKVEPTFREFVQYILDGNIRDRHWRPIYLLTFPCVLNYTILGKIETFNDDTNYILRKHSLDGVSSVWRNQKHSEPTDPSVYYAQLTKQQLVGLYKIYKMDFLLFNYSYHPYDTYVQNIG